MLPEATPESASSQNQTGLDVEDNSANTAAKMASVKVESTQQKSLQYVNTMETKMPSKKSAFTRKATSVPAKAEELIRRLVRPARDGSAVDKEKQSKSDAKPVWKASSRDEPDLVNDEAKIR